MELKMMPKMVCELCQKEFFPKNPKSFSGMMRRHRDKAHPLRRGPIRYNAVHPTIH